MIRFIDEYRDRFGVELICRVLSEAEGGFITSRGYRAAKARQPSARALCDRLLIGEITRLHAENFSVYGVRKMWHVMHRAGWQIGRDQIARLMREAGVRGVVRGRRPRTSMAAPDATDERPDLVERDFAAAAPGKLWVADITYVRTSCGFVNTAFVTDAHSRRIVGWATRSSMTTEALSLEALEHALNTARDHSGQNLGHELVHHSVRGSQGGFNRSSPSPRPRSSPNTGSGLLPGQWATRMTVSLFPPGSARIGQSRSECSDPSLRLARRVPWR